MFYFNIAALWTEKDQKFCTISIFAAITFYKVILQQLKEYYALETGRNKIFMYLE